MTAKALILELQELVKKHGNKKVYANGLCVMDVSYDVADDTIDID